MRNIRNEYEMPDDDSDEDVGLLLRKREVNFGMWVVGFVLLALFIAGIYGIVRIDGERSNDNFCTGCHMIPEKTYSDRADSAMAGALAADLASFHYQQIHGQGGTVRCVDCHQGTGDFRGHLDVTLISARNGFDWLIAHNDPKIEKLHLQSPQLVNDSCVSCHQKTLLLAGMDNHYHNMLPVAYELWRNGGRLIAPAGAKDVQTIIAAGLVKYDTTLGCSDCHQAHRNIETDQYLDRDAVLPAKCVQCHRDVGKGPLGVSFPASQ